MAKRSLFLDPKTTNFVMIHKIKIDVPSNLFNKVLIPSNLEASTSDLVNNNP